MGTHHWDSLRQGERLAALRKAGTQGLDPAAPDDTLALLLAAAHMRGARTALEIGTGEGLTALSLLSELSDLRLTTIENDAARRERALAHFAEFGVQDRVCSLEGDAALVLPTLGGRYDLIFLDGPKAQYVHYLPLLKGLLAPRGVLFADDVLLYGWVDGSAEPPPKRRSIAARLREYLDAVFSDPDLYTVLCRTGEGAAISVLRGECERPKARSARGEEGE